MTTPLLDMPEVSEGVVNQATNHNTALRVLEALTFRALSMSETTPAVGAAEGDTYIIPSGATGVWSGKTNQMALWIGGAWRYYDPMEGIGGIWVNDEDTAYSFDGSAWVASGGAGATAPFSDSTAILKGSVDATKQVKFEVDGLTTATTRTVTVPDKNGTMAMLDDVTTAVAALVAAAPGALDTLDELAAALGDDANFAATVTTALAAKVAGPASAVGDRVALFDGTTGKLIKDSGLTLAGTNTGDETVATAGALINGATDKATPVDADYLGLMDSAASNVLKKLSWANLKATLKTYFDTLYALLAQTVNSQTGTTYTYLDGDRGKLVTHSNASAIAGTLPQAGAGSEFIAGWYVDVQNRGAGTLTITPATSTVDGAATLAFTTGQGCRIVSDGTNYFTQRGGAGTAGGGGSATSITGTTGATGGDATATGGTSTTSANVGGGVIITGGTPGATGAGGPVTISGGPGGTTSGNAGNVLIRGGVHGPTNVAGSVTITGRDAPVTPGSLTLSGGTATAGGAGGAVNITSGTGESGSGGVVAITAGNGNNGAAPGGAITMTAGQGGFVTGAGGAITITGGQASAGNDTFSGTGGGVNLVGGRSRGADSGAAVTLTGGLGGSTGHGGKVALVGGAAGGGNNNGGNIGLKGGAPTGTGATGNVVLNDSGSALATTAIGGFTCFPTCAGTPTGTPASVPTGTVAMVFDTTNSKLYAYVGAAWISTAAFT